MEKLKKGMEEIGRKEKQKIYVEEDKKWTKLLTQLSTLHY